MQDQDIAGVLKVGIATVERVRRLISQQAGRCVEEGLEGARGQGRRVQLDRRQKKLDWPGRGPSDSLGLFPAPCGPGRLDPATNGGLADQLVELEIVESISRRRCVGL